MVLTTKVTCSNVAACPLGLVVMQSHPPQNIMFVGGVLVKTDTFLYKVIASKVRDELVEAPVNKRLWFYRSDVFHIKSY